MPDPTVAAVYDRRKLLILGKPTLIERRYSGIQAQFQSFSGNLLARDYIKPSGLSKRQPSRSRGFDEMLDAVLSIFDALLRAVEALEHLFVAFCVQAWS